MNIQSADHILLTGAGFTKNFGGFLGSEMWSLIFNHPLISESSYLKDLLTRNQDFEMVYSEVIDNESASEEDKEIIQKVVGEAYKDLDDAIKNWTFNTDSPYPVNWYGVQKLLSIFSGDRINRGFYFTLNQDIFMERMSGSLCPGVPRFPQGLYQLRGTNIVENQFVTLPSGAEAEKKFLEGMNNHNGPVYIKLHGSYGWKSSYGSNPMIIGKNKSALIEQEPLLKIYLELFKSVLNSGNKKLLVIGYGFGDGHINEIIWDAAKNHGLRIYIISPNPPGEFPAGNFIYDSYRLWDSIDGYFPFLLKDIFPSNQEETVLFTKIRESLLRT